MSFLTYSLQENRCVRLLIKTSARGYLNVVLGELGSLNIHDQGVKQLRSSRRDQDPAKDRPPTPTSLCLWRGARSCLRCDLSPSYAA